MSVSCLFFLSLLRILLWLETRWLTYINLLQVCFHPAGSLVLTASQDTTCRLWDTATNDCLQILDGHSDEVFSCAFSYYGDSVVTASKDNSLIIWRWKSQNLHHSAISCSLLMILGLVISEVSYMEAEMIWHVKVLVNFFHCAHLSFTPSIFLLKNM